MALPPDYHMHTPLCGHAVGEPREYAAQAVRLGLSEIGFSEHAPMPRDDFDTWRMRAADLDDYVERVGRAQREWPQLTIRLGLEVDYLPGCEDWIRDLAGRHSWDFLIGSVHYVTDDWAVDDPARRMDWHQRDPDEIWTAYVERLKQAAATGLFDILGHIDLPKKFGVLPRTDIIALYDAFLQSLRGRPIAIEVNTAGLRKDCRERYPGRALLEQMIAYSLPTTFGSDAHAPAEVGWAFSETVALLRSLGVAQVRTFEQRQHRDVPL